MKFCSNNVIYKKKYHNKYLSDLFKTENVLIESEIEADNKDNKLKGFHLKLSLLPK